MTPMLPPVHSPRANFAALPRRLVRAFSLVELLAVMAIMAIMTVAATPMLSGILRGQGLTSIAFGISETLTNARAHAVANNTYVWVGIDEVDQTPPLSASPQRRGTGRVVLSVVASRDGTRIYDPNGDVSSDWAAQTAIGNRLSQISKLLCFDHVHLAGDLAPGASGTRMERPWVDPTFRIGGATPASAIKFNYPLGKSDATAQYSFQKVVQFDPQGSAIIFIQGEATLARLLEIGLRPTAGNSIVASEVNQAALQVEGLTGATAIYRP